MPVKHRASRPRTPKPVQAPPSAEAATLPEPVQAMLVPASGDPVSEHEEITRLAYSYWEARGRRHGFDQEDWARAEQEYRRRKSSL